MPPETDQEASTAVPKWPGPNHQLNTLHILIQDQLEAETLLKSTEDTMVRVRTEQEIKNRNKKMAATLHEYEHDPFVVPPINQYTDEERLVLRRLHRAIQSELDEPSETNRAELKAAHLALVFLAYPEKKNAAENEKGWMPRRVLEGGHEDSSSEESVIWRPVHMRRDKSKAFYKVDDPDKSLGDSVHTTPWDTVPDQQPSAKDSDDTDKDENAGKEAPVSEWAERDDLQDDAGDDLEESMLITGAST